MAPAKCVYSPVLPSPTIHKSHGDDTSTAVLTYPVIDAEGEWIQPDGGDWSQYPLNPKVNWHHGEPIGRGEVTLKAVSIDGKNWVVPVGTTRFAAAESDFDGLDLRKAGPNGLPTSQSYSRSECLHVARQASQLVLADIATGVSIELSPLERTPLGRSLLRGGTAFAYPRWKGLGWAHTLAGDQINPGAQTVAKALEVGRSGKLPGGEAMLPVIRKAFDSLLKAKPNRASVVGGYVAKSADASGHEHDKSGKFSSKGERADAHGQSVAASTLSRAAKKFKGGDEAASHADAAEGHANKAHESGAPEHHQAAAESHKKAAAAHGEAIKSSGSDYMARQQHVMAQSAHGEAARRHAALAKAFTKRVGKAMDYEPMEPTMYAPPLDDTAAALATPEAEESDTPPEASDAYDAAQMLSDMATKLRDRGTKSLHKPTKKYFLKLAEEMEADAEDLMAHAGDVETEAGMGSKEEGGEGEGEAPAEGEAADTSGDDAKKEEKAHRLAYDDHGFPDRSSPTYAVHLKRDKAGWLVLKASRYVPRLRLADLKPVPKAAPPEDPETVAARTELGSAFQRLTANIRPARRNRWGD